MTNAELVRRRARVVGILHRAAATVVACGFGVLLGPQPHRDADDLIALFQQQSGGDRGVDSPRHGDNDTSISHSSIMV